MQFKPLGIVGKKKMLLEIKFKPRYFCIGAYWRKVQFSKYGYEYVVNIFLLPMVSIRCRWVEIKSKYEQ